MTTTTQNANMNSLILMSTKEFAKFLPKENKEGRYYEHITGNIDLQKLKKVKFPNGFIANVGGLKIYGVEMPITNPFAEENKALTWKQDYITTWSKGGTGYELNNMVKDTAHHPIGQCVIVKKTFAWNDAEGKPTQATKDNQAEALAKRVAKEDKKQKAAEQHDAAMQQAIENVEQGHALKEMAAEDLPPLSEGSVILNEDDDDMMGVVIKVDESLFQEALEEEALLHIGHEDDEICDDIDEKHKINKGDKYHKRWRALKTYFEGLEGEHGLLDATDVDIDNINEIYALITKEEDED